MSAGIEPLKTSIRIWWRDASGKRDRETLYDTPPTDTNLKKSQRNRSIDRHSDRNGYI